jgi:cell division inhibitor SepF
MSLIDKFLNVMRLNDDEDFTFDNEDYLDEEYEEEKEKRKPSKPKAREKKESSFDDSQKDRAVKTSPKITPISKGARKQGVAGMEVCVIKPTSVEDAREITETLLNGRTVVLNVEGLDIETAQRIIDFTSGSCFAISGNFQKISNYIFIITPANVDISGDVLSLVDSLDSNNYNY